MSCQKNSVIGDFMKRSLCTRLISMAVSRSNKLWNKQKSKYKVSNNDKVQNNFINFIQ